MSTSLSIYIHFPFCISKCRYCDFYSEVQNADTIDTYIKALTAEWEEVSKKYKLTGATIQTLYFGGGTPSCLSEDQFYKLYNCLIKTFRFSSHYEWSVECNPDSFTINKAGIYAECGVTRLTFGIQSLNEKELRIMGRPHTAEKAIETLYSSCLNRFESIGADLIYGLPGQSLLSYENSLNCVLGSPYVKHLSLYELTINDHTPFGRHQNLLQLPDDDTVASMWEKSTAICKRHGFEHYEVSNYALPGYHSRHNEMYWNHQNYIGLGPSAHSYIHPERWSNFADIKTYIAKCLERKSCKDYSEMLDGAKLAHEMIFLGLRRSIGLNEEDLRIRTGEILTDNGRSEKLENFISAGYLVYEPPWWRPTEKGMLYADAMARDLFE